MGTPNSGRRIRHFRWPIFGVHRTTGESYCSHERFIVHLHWASSPICGKVYRLKRQYNFEIRTFLDATSIAGRCYMHSRRVQAKLQRAIVVSARVQCGRMQLQGNFQSA